jgi:mRNA interferase RelE/StbE
MYKIVINKKLLKSLDNISVSYLSGIKQAINELASNPRPFGYRKLAGYEDVFRIRVGIYRIIYTIEDEILTVVIIKIDHRSSVYRK